MLRKFPKLDLSWNNNRNAVLFLRYDCERLSNGLNRMVPFHNFEEELEGYAPHLTSLISGLHYASRPEGFSLRDLPDVDVQDMERWRERILEAIDLQTVHIANGNEIPLDESNGANILGSLIEANSSSPNKAFYGSLHNWGHVLIARIHDADGRYQVSTLSLLAEKQKNFYVLH